MGRSHPRGEDQGRLNVNLRAIWAIYSFEMARTGRTLLQSIVAPVITTSLYFVVFGAAMGTRISQIEGVDYGAMIAASSIFSIPVLIFFLLMQRRLVSGMTSGAVKE